MSDKYDLDYIFSEGVPRSLELSRNLDRAAEPTFRQRFIARWVGQFHRRIAMPEEYNLKTTEESPGFEVQFVAPRVPLGLTIKLESNRELTAATVQVWHDGEWREEVVRCIPSPMQERGVLYIGFQRLMLTTRIQAFIEGLKREDQFKIIAQVAEYSYEDWLTLDEARQMAALGDKLGAESNYLRSLKLAPKNGVAALEAAQLLLDHHKSRQAEQWALVGGVYGDSKIATDLLQTIYEQDGAEFAKEAPQLSVEAAGWPVGEHHGAICLKMHRQYWLGFDSWHLVKYRSLVEIRRRAAARMLRRLQFQLTPHNEDLLFARLRILQKDGNIRTATDEQFTFTDSPEHDPAIRTAGKKDVSIFVPELHIGDVMELEYCLVHDNSHLKDGRPNFFLMVDMVSNFPTFTSTVDIVCPESWPVRCIGIHRAEEPVRTTDEDGWQMYTAKSKKLIADDWGTSSYERMLHNPHICCSWDNRTWEDVGQHELQSVSPAVEPPDPLPQVLGEIIAGDDPPLGKLERGFSWVRDRLKYMSLPSAKGRIAKQGRAQHILDAGVGDCHDKAYLLHLICRELGLETEFLLVNADNGYVVRELPGGQFDHVLVRVKLPDSWLYLDATDSMTPFGYIPGALQGHSTLRLGDEVQLVTIPENTPASNSITISEVLECSNSGYLEGRFRFVASGQAGRWQDERWKSLAMGAPDLNHAARVVLNDHIPSARMEQWKVDDYPGEDGCFVFTGRHTRCRLTKIGTRRVGFVDWDSVFFPYETLRNRRWAGFALFPMPLTLTLSVEVNGGRHWQIEGSSTIPAFDTDFGAVSEERINGESQLVITRKLVVKKKFVRGPTTEQIPEFLKVAEEMLQMALLFEHRESSSNMNPTHPQL